MTTDYSRRDLLRAVAQGAVLAPLGAACAYSSAAPSAPHLPGALRESVLERMHRWGLPGLSVAVVQDGEVRACDGLGRASLSFDVPVTAHTLFHAGSVGKHVTAAAVLRLIAGGRMEWDAPIGRYVPKVPQAWASRSIRSLLTHCSGLPDYAGSPDYAWDRNLPRAGVFKAATLPTLFAEGEAWSYSNTGYVLLGYALEDITGASYAEHLRSTLFTPLELREARPDAAEEIIAQRAEPYESRAEGLRHAVRMRSDVSAAPDGGVLFSAHDAALWELALASGRVLNAPLQQRMFSPARLASGREISYGCAWFLEKLPDGRPIHWHTGGVPGFTTAYFRAPAAGISVVVFSNVDLGSSRPQREVALRIAEQLAPGSTPLALPHLHDRNPSRTARARAILYRGEQPLDPEWFVPEVQAMLKAPEAAMVAPSLPDGEPRDFMLVQESALPARCTLRRYRAVYDERIEHFTFRYDATGKIYWAGWL